MGWVVLGLAILIAVDLIVHVGFSLLVLPLIERKPPFAARSGEPHIDAEPIEFGTTHGLMLRGSLHGMSDAPRGLIVFCPEYGGSHWLATEYAGSLIDAGFVVLAFDFRNQGESDALAGYEPLHWLTDYEVADVHAALKYAASREDLRGLPVGLFGISRGGGAALATAADNPSVRFVAAEGAFSMRRIMTVYSWRWAELYVPGWILKLAPRWHVEWTLAVARTISRFRRRCRFVPLERCLPRLRDRRVLLIAGERDTYVPADVVGHLSSRIGGSQVEQVLVADARHNGARDADSATYDARLCEFFDPLCAAPREPQPV